MLMRLKKPLLTVLIYTINKVTTQQVIKVAVTAQIVPEIRYLKAKNDY